MDENEVVKRLKKMGDQRCIEGMARFGINPENNLGVSVTDIRSLAKEIGKDHQLALQLWNTGIRDARMVAACIDEPAKVTEEQLESWVLDFNSWDLCDHTTGTLFDKTPYAYDKVREWSRREEEFVKRAAFALIAWLVMHDKKAGDEVFIQLFPIIEEGALDERNYVKKAVSWALRNIGKQNFALNKAALKTARRLKRNDSKPARWIASDAIRELEGEKVQERLRTRAKK
jgi:3-methyladenine DNA glycosylase AlkD